MTYLATLFQRYKPTVDPSEIPAAYFQNADNYWFASGNTFLLGNGTSPELTNALKALADADELKLELLTKLYKDFEDRHVGLTTARPWVILGFKHDYCGYKPDVNSVKTCILPPHPHGTEHRMIGRLEFWSTPGPGRLLLMKSDKPGNSASRHKYEPFPYYKYFGDPKYASYLYNSYLYHGYSTKKPPPPVEPYQDELFDEYRPGLVYWKAMRWPDLKAHLCYQPRAKRSLEHLYPDAHKYL